MNVSLTPELESLINERVASGRYRSASEVVREALRLLADQDDLQQARLDEIRARVATGLDELDNGEGIDGEDFMNSLLTRLEARAAGK